MWAPRPGKLTLRISRKGSSTQDIPMQRDGDDYVASARAGAGDRYAYVLEDGLEVPDPVSRFLPEGVHGPTEIVDPAAFQWHDDEWRGLGLRDYVIYELHIGTFTPAGTFDAAIEKLEYLKQLGITVVEMMPVAACPGTRNWGYDGVSLYAVQANYGGPEGLKRFVDAAHRIGLAVMLDVVYNHLGPEGNYLPKFGPYFTAITTRHGATRSTTTAKAASRCGATWCRMRATGFASITSTACGWTRCRPSRTIRRRHIVAEIQQRVQELARELGRTVKRDRRNRRERFALYRSSGQ